MEKKNTIVDYYFQDFKSTFIFDSNSGTIDTCHSQMLQIENFVKKYSTFIYLFSGVKASSLLLTFDNHMGHMSKLERSQFGKTIYDACSTALTMYYLKQRTN